MDYQFSDRVNGLKPSAIREIFKYSADPAYIPLSAGNPAPEAFPGKEIREISDQILKETPIAALQYGMTEGYPALRSHLGAYLQTKYNIGSPEDLLIITSGAQQVMDLFTKSMINPGDVVLCEEPSFIGSLNTFRSYQAKLRGIPMESDGIDLNALEHALKTESRVKFLYTIPNFQNPSGITMSAEKRRAVYALCKAQGVMILEDNPYGEVRFSGEAIPSIKSLDKDGIVMYAGTFSKVISPGMRVGYAVGPASAVQKMIVCKQGADVHSNMWAQIVCHRLMTEYDYDAHLKRLQELYRKKYQLLERAMQEHLTGRGITWNKPQGGLFVWCSLPKGVDMPAFSQDALLQHVCIVPGTAFLCDDTAPSSAFRINFSTPTDEQLLTGIERLGKVPMTR